MNHILHPMVQADVPTPSEEEMADLAAYYASIGEDPSTDGLNLNTNDDGYQNQ